ncbi:MAG: type II secretion system F family protein, partial [bacterium]|nr:type II secretion system F family protein [bacterium]
MEFGAFKKPSEDKHQEADATDYIVEGAEEGKEVLNRVKKEAVIHGDNVIYGVYDNSDKGLSVRLNDFFIDRSKVDLKDKSYFFHMLAVMVDAGIPVVGAVKSLATRTKNRRFMRVLNTIAHVCEEGSNLADSMSRFEDVFEEAELGIVRSGEETGRLHTMLFKLSEQLDRRHDLYMKLWGAAVYPIAVLSVLVLVTTGMLVWIFPTLLSLLQEGGASSADLPFATRILIGLQNAVVNFWWLILVVIAGIYGLFAMYRGSSYGAVRWDYAKLKMPIVGGLMRRVFVLRFVSMLGILIEAGLPVIKVLRITGNSLSNRIYKLKVQEIIEEVRIGGKISASIKDSEFLFPSEVSQMLGIGEASASVAKVSDKISDQYQREIDNSLRKLTSVFEP